MGNELPGWPTRVVGFVQFSGIPVWEILIGSVRVALIVLGNENWNIPASWRCRSASAAAGGGGHGSRPRLRRVRSCSMSIGNGT